MHCNQILKINSWLKVAVLAAEEPVLYNSVKGTGCLCWYQMLLPGKCCRDIPVCGDRSSIRCYSAADTNQQQWRWAAKMLMSGETGGQTIGRLGSTPPALRHLTEYWIHHLCKRWVVERVRRNKWLRPADVSSDSETLLETLWSFL